MLLEIQYCCQTYHSVWSFSCAKNTSHSLIHRLKCSSWQNSVQVRPPPWQSLMCTALYSTLRKEIYEKLALLELPLQLNFCFLSCLSHAWILETAAPWQSRFSWACWVIKVNHWWMSIKIKQGLYVLSDKASSVSVVLCHLIRAGSRHTWSREALQAGGSQEGQQALPPCSPLPAP